MQITKTLDIKNRAAWRAWLEKNYDKKDEIWLIYYKRSFSTNKKSSGIKSISYDEAVEEALCFGWIDGIEKGIDKDRFAQRFTPRREKSNWSKSNIERVKKLIKMGKMTQAGLEKVKDLVIFKK